MEQNTELRPKVGIGVMVMKDGKMLLGKRKSSHGAGEYATPGGHLEYMEGFEECARREVKEETGIEIKNVRLLYVANIKRYAPKHYAHLTLIADWASGNPEVLEPDKCESWGWYDVDAIPTPFFATTDLAVEAYKTGKIFFDSVV